LRRLGVIPIALGESLPLPSLKQVLSEGLADWLQPNVAAAGGITPTLELLRDAAASGLGTALHAWGTPIMTAAALHVAAAARGAPLVEIDLTPNPLRELVTQALPQPTAGELRLPEHAGLGVEIDLQRLRWLQERNTR
jgi:L-alanine-DL-glutamate epimerase-like enolase superfamily enzyme